MTCAIDSCLTFRCSISVRREKVLGLQSVLDVTELPILANEILV